nr:DNA helicase [Tanacetum cinerariifolium]
MTMEFQYMFVERCVLTASGAINYHPGTVVANGDGNIMLISTVFGRLRDMLTRNALNRLLNYHPDTVVANRDGNIVPISTIFGRLRDMLTRNGGSNFSPRTGESPICRPPPVTTRSPHMFDESLELTSLGVTNSSDGRVVTRPERTIVPISTIFGRFKDMPVSSAEVNSTDDTARVVDLMFLSTIGHAALIINFDPSNANIPNDGAVSWNSSIVVNIEVDEEHPSPHADFLPAYMDLGKFYMNQTPDPPPFIQKLLRNTHFMENIRAYNQMFAMTSFGEKVGELINREMGPYVFKISGQIYHWIGSLCLEDGDHPRFLQMYIYDTDNEVKNRMRHFGGLDAPGLNLKIVEGLIHVFNEHNGLIRLFRTARDRCSAGEIPRFKIRLYNLGGVRGYELSMSDVLRSIVFEDVLRSQTDFNVIVEFRGGPPKRINKLHQSYMSLQFPLLFVFGPSGFYLKLILKPWNGRGEGRKVTMNAYYKYQLHSRPKEFGLLFKSGRLFQQYVVTIFCAIEQSRLDFICKRQKDLRSDYLSGLYDAISRGDRWGIMAGSIILLPSTFTGGPRYMYSHYLDALAISRSLGNPQFFITFTCNVKWPEIKRYMSRCPGLTPADMADIVCRVFQQKVKDFVKFLKEVKRFGRVVAVLYIIEFQKRGMPHYHTLLWVDSNNKITDALQIDEYISAELPNLVKDLRGYKVVSELMLHGPCGAVNLSAPCTSIGEPSTSTSANNKNIDEIQNYVDGHFICLYEACWRIFDFPIHSQEPAMQILNIHLEDKQHVTFRARERERLDTIVNIPERKKTTPNELFVYNNENIDGRQLTMLMSHQKGCKSPTDVRIVNGEIFPTYRAACEALGLLGDDKEWDIALQESAFSATSSEMRTLFAQILIYYDVPPPGHLLKDLKNKLLMEKKNYNRELLMQDAIRAVICLWSRWNKENIFLWKTIISSLRSQGKIVLAVVSSGIASLLLPMDRTAHSRFKLPLELTDESLCHVKKNTQLGKLLVETNLIIWDEAPMNDRRYFETLDRTLRDLMSSPDLIFGGKTVVLGEVFAKWLLDIGNGETGDPDNEDNQDNCWISIPPEYCVSSDDAGMSELINFIYDQTTLKTPTAEAL